MNNILTNPSDLPEDFEFTDTEDKEISAIADTCLPMVENMAESLKIVRRGLTAIPEIEDRADIDELVKAVMPALDILAKTFIEFSDTTRTITTDLYREVMALRRQLGA